MELLLSLGILIGRGENVLLQCSSVNLGYCQLSTEVKVFWVKRTWAIAPVPIGVSSIFSNI